MFSELIRQNRSYRRFDETRPIGRDMLRKLIDLARLSPSGGNLQPLKFVLSCTPESNATIFPHLAWAGYLKDWPGPAEGERPTGYIVILHDKEVAPGAGCDHGIAAQSMLLGAVEEGFGGCMIGAVDRKGLRAALRLPDRYDILLVIALGIPAETVKIETVTDATGVKYWRDDADVHHVPKRSLDDLILDLD
ncbi:MAG: nitroreductase family protein [Planctomycetes bacterium]|nr:nitroreductase family protein [Planctomycetota bacterium]